MESIADSDELPASVICWLGSDRAASDRLGVYRRQVSHHDWQRRRPALPAPTLMERVQELENLSICIVREAYACFEGPAVLWSMGKEFTVLIAPCRKAFMGTVPFPVIHIDTGRKFPSRYAFRDKWDGAWNLQLLVASNAARSSAGVDYVDKLACCTALRTEALKQVLHSRRFDTLMLAVRSDEHVVRVKERHFSPRDNLSGCTWKSPIPSKEGRWDSVVTTRLWSRTGSRPEYFGSAYRLWQRTGESRFSAEPKVRWAVSKQ